MTTSSSERGRCTRISPSAVLDDRLFGKDLEWARDHLRRCDTCRGRIEDFQEMVLRVERLPHAPVDSQTLEEAFLYAVPDAPRPVPSQTRIVSPAYQRMASVATMPPLPITVPEVTPAPDVFTEMEPDLADARWNPESVPTPLDWMETEAPEPQSPDAPAIEAPDLSLPLVRERGINPELPVRAVEIDSGERVAESPAAAPGQMPEGESPPDEGLPDRRWDAIMRIAVGLGAAACVLLAALLYEGGLLSSLHIGKLVLRPSVAATVAAIRPTVHPSVHPSIAPTPSPSIGTVLATLGDGVSGERVFRIRPGTAYSSYTRLVFDLTGTGLPSMVVSQLDPTHVLVIFKNTTGTDVAVAGIHSIQVAAIEPAVQVGADLHFTIDLNRPVHLVEFTLPPGSGYAPRLVLDLHG
jgi:hypothetical protein